MSAVLLFLLLYLLLFAAVDVSTDIIVFIAAGDVVIVDVDYVVANVCH